MKTIRRQFVQNAGPHNTIFHQRVQINGRHMKDSAGYPHAPGPENLLDSREKPVAIGQHGRVELLAAILVYAARLERFQIKPDGSDGSFEFVGYRVNEGVVLLIAA